MSNQEVAVPSQVSAWTGPSRRRTERFELQTPLDVTVLRSGIPDTMPGRALDLGERGIAAMLAGELVPGEAVGIEVQLPILADLLRTRATVKYQDRLRCGFEFVGLSTEHLESIRDCAKHAKAQGTAGSGLAGRTEKGKKPASPNADSNRSSGAKSGRRHGLGWAILVVVLILACGASLFWWKWNQAWKELESGLKTEQTTTAEQRPQAQVPAEVMEKLLIHRVEPAYPAEARRTELQGVIALDIVIGRDGSVINMRALNGPEVLVKAAMDALRWWKFEPYRLNGEPAIVETTVAVEFKR